MTRNKLSAKPTVPMSSGATPLIVSQRTVSIGSDSKMWVRDNQLSSEGSDCMMFITKISTSGNAAVAFESNVFAAHSGGVPVLGVQQELALSGSSEIVIADNDMKCHDDRIAYFAPFSFGGGINLQDESVLSFLRNDFDIPANRVQKQNFIGVPPAAAGAASTVKRSDGAGLFFCGNKHYNAPLADAQLPAEVKTALGAGGLVSDPSAIVPGTCGVKVTEKPAETPYVAPTTTAAPAPTTNAKGPIVDDKGNPIDFNNAAPGVGVGASLVGGIAAALFAFAGALL